MTTFIPEISVPPSVSSGLGSPSRWKLDRKLLRYRYPPKKDKAASQQDRMLSWRIAGGVAVLPLAPALPWEGASAPLWKSYEPPARPVDHVYGSQVGRRQACLPGSRPLAGHR